MRKICLTFIIGLALAQAAPGEARGQNLGHAAIGGSIGFVGGAVSTLSIVVARARFQGKYLDSAHDLIHWQTVPLIVGPAAGVTFGFMGEDVLRGSIVGSTTGMVIGTAVGAGLGWVISADQEAPWAGGVIGAGVGLNLGGAVGALLGWRKSEEEKEAAGQSAPLEFSLSIPF